jgi:hypothetical protein
LGAGDNYAEVDDAANDGDTSYNSSSTDGDEDYFEVEDIPTEYAGGAVLAAQLDVVARQTASGGCFLTPNIDGNDGDSSACSINYKTHSMLIVDAGGSPAAALTNADIDDMIVGYKLTVV